MVRQIKYIFLFALLFFSCKKTKLEGDLAVLIGEWEWKETLKYGSVCDGLTGGITVSHNPSIDEFTYSLKFHKKGKLDIIKNGKKDKSYRLVLRGYNIPNQYAFYLNNRKKKSISFGYEVNAGKEYLLSTDFPLSLLIEPGGCVSEVSKFERIK